MGCGRRAKLLVFILSFSIPIAAGAAVLVWLYLSYIAFTPDEGGPKGINALWVRHQWVGEQRAEKDYADFAAALKRNSITDIFVHVGPLDKFGMIAKTKYPFAGVFLREMKKAYPELRIQAWIGQVEKSAGGPLDLADRTVRGYIIQTAADLLDAGFDGIHYDIEPVRSGNMDFISLLRNTRMSARKRNKILSIASGQIELVSGIGQVVELFARTATLWEKSYFLEVAKYVDQFAVMTYDTQMPTDWLYGNYVKWETRGILKLVGDRATVFMGVPTYRDARRKAQTFSENINSGIRGVQMGLKGMSAEQAARCGIAIYAEWTTDDAEWRVFRKEWLGEK